MQDLKSLTNSPSEATISTDFDFRELEQPIRTLKKPKSNLLLSCARDSFQTDDYNKMHKKQSYLVFVTIDKNIEQVTIEMCQSATVQNAIDNTLNILNEFRLKSLQSKDFEIYIVKKNGKPQLDYPAFQLDQLLKKTGLQSFALVFTPKNSVQTQQYYKILNQSQSQLDVIAPSLSPIQSPKRKGIKSNYSNSLQDPNTPPKSLQDIPVVIKKKKTTWFFSLLRCGCNEFKD